jgi:uncharacterized PurR-regulated membrane protein YhhQ (DUF165 family)
MCLIPCKRVASRAAYIVVNHSDVHDPTMIRKIMHPEIVLDSIRVRNAPCCFYRSQQFSCAQSNHVRRIMRPSMCLIPCKCVASRAAYIVVNHSDVHDSIMVQKDQAAFTARHISKSRYLCSDFLLGPTC